MRSIRVGRSSVQLGAAVAMATALGIGAAGPLGASAQQPPVDPTQVIPLRPGVSPNQGVVNSQIQRARARFAVTSRQPHPGSPEAITHPQLDHAGSGLSARPHPQVMATVAPASSSSQPGMDVSGYQG